MDTIVKDKTRYRHLVCKALLVFIAVSVAVLFFLEALFANTAQYGELLKRTSFSNILGDYITTNRAESYINESSSSVGRVDSIDWLRMAIILYISICHFIYFFVPRGSFFANFMSNHASIVGSCFVITGFVAAMTGINISQIAVKPQYNDTRSFVVKRTIPLWSMNLVILIIFAAPIYIGLPADTPFIPQLFTVFLHHLLLQSFIPLNEDLYNPPAWFLSSLIPSFFILPVLLRFTCKQKTSTLKKGCCFLMLLACGYRILIWSLKDTIQSYFTNLDPRLRNKLISNHLAFHPIVSAIDVAFGAFVGSYFLREPYTYIWNRQNRKSIDSGYSDDSEYESYNSIGFIPYVGIPIIGVIVIFSFIALEWFVLEEYFVRAFFITPIITSLVVRMFRRTAWGNLPFFGSSTVKFLNNSNIMIFTPLVSTYSFPLFLIHVPVGFMFFKKSCSGKIFGEGKVAQYPISLVMPILVVVIVYLIQNYIFKSRLMANFNGYLIRKLS